VVDPLAEWHFNYTPYHYCLNNPIKYIDPFGLDTIPVNKVDWPEFDSEKDVVQLDEVTVTGKRPNWLVRTARKIGRAITEGGDGETIPGGINFVRSGIAIDPTKTTSENHVETINIDDLLRVLGFPGAGRFNRSPLDAAKGLKSVTDAALNNTEHITSDRDIVNNHTGTAQKTDANGRPIENVTPLGTEADSIKNTRTLLFDDVEGNTYQDFKIHKNTRMGRPISNPYK
jgi:hypothetical protein